MQTRGDKGRQSGWNQKGSDSLQSEVIHSHPGVVHVKKHPVKVHIGTNNLKWRGQVLFSQLTFQSDVRDKKHLCTNTLQKGFMAMSSFQAWLELQELLREMSLWDEILKSAFTVKYPLKIPCWKE